MWNISVKASKLSYPFNCKDLKLTDNFKIKSLDRVQVIMKTSACNSISHLVLHFTQSVVNVCRGVKALLPMMTRKFALSLFVAALHPHASTAPTILYKAFLRNSTSQKLHKCCHRFPTLYYPKFHQESGRWLAIPKSSCSLAGNVSVALGRHIIGLERVGICPSRKALKFKGWLSGWGYWEIQAQYCRLVKYFTFCNSDA